MKTIVCYGDSNTYGADPASGKRYAPDVRWTGVLQAELGLGYRVIEEGLSGRTTNLDDIRRLGEWPEFEAERDIAGVADLQCIAML